MANKAALAKFIKAGEGYDRDQIVQSAIPKVGSTKVDYQLSDSCTTAIEARLKSASRKAMPNAAKKS